MSDQVDDGYLEADRDHVLYPQRKIKMICEELDISCLDLTDAIYRNGGRSLFRDYLHLKGEGNDVVAETVTKYLRSVAH